METPMRSTSPRSLRPTNQSRSSSPSGVSRSEAWCNKKPSNLDACNRCKLVIKLSSQLWHGAPAGNLLISRLVASVGQQFPNTTSANRQIFSQSALCCPWFECCFAFLSLKELARAYESFLFLRLLSPGHRDCKVNQYWRLLPVRSDQDRRQSF